MTAYGADLAHVHDTGFGDFARRAAPGLLRLFARAGIRDGLVVDLGCGSGIWARALADAGYDVLGVDLSADMLAIARERVPEARFEQASLFEAELPPCAAITSLGECMGYAFDPRSGAASLAAVFRRAHSALRAGGVLMFDLAVPGRERPQPRRSWYEGDGWTLCLEAWEEPRRSVLVREMSVFRRRGESYTRSDERHEVVLHPPDEVLAALAAAGFDARALRGYGRGLRFRRGIAGFAATKPR